MAIQINGTSGISGVDGSAGTPALQGTDSNTGISFGTDTVNINTGGTTRATVDSSGRVGIGTNSPVFLTDILSGTANTGANVNNPSQLSVTGPNKSLTGGGATVFINSNTDLAVDTGGSIALSGRNTTSSTNSVVWGVVKGAKENGTSGNTAGYLAFASANHAAGSLVEAMRIDSSQRVGIGTTSPGELLSVNGNILIASTYRIKTGDSGGNLTIQGGATFPGGHIILNGGNGSDNIIFNRSGASASSIETARIDSSGRLLVGTSSARTVGWWDTPKVQIDGLNYQQASLLIYNNSNDTYPAVLALGKSRGAAIGSNTIVQNGDELGEITFYGSDGSNETRGAAIGAYVDGTPGTNDMPGRLVFSTTADGASSPTERMRIAQDGACQYYANTSFNVRTARTSTTADAFSVHKGASSTTTGTLVFQVMADGDCENTNNAYGAISDVKLKENIVDANSQWDDLKALQVRNYSFKKETSYETHRQIGLIAQEVEQVSPGLVTESPDRDAEGNYLGTVTKSVNYSVLYMKAVKALQEAMERIETLETRVAQLEGGAS